MTDASARRGRWRRAAAVAALLLAGNALPLPGGSRSRFGPLGPDKWLHAAGHAVLAAALADALSARHGRREAAVSAAAASVVYGGGLELLQRRVPGRPSERADFVAQAVGSVLGVVGWRRVAGR